MIGLRMTALALIAVTLAGCSGADARNAGTTIDASGDTVVAHTAPPHNETPATLVREISIGESDGAPEYSFSEISDLAVGNEGQIYVWDRKEKALRLYDAQGRFVRQIGRSGSGPGEYDRINGIAVRADGKLAVWDAGNGRINLYAANGDYETTWKLTSGFFTSRAVTSDTANNVYIRASVRRDSTKPFGVTGYIRFGPDGIATDSLVPPAIGPEPKNLTASTKSMSVSYGIPYFPSRQWTFSPHGYFVAGPGDPYVLYALPPNGKPVKIERASEPVAVDPADKAEARETTLFGMRQSFPEYQWSGPDIPDHKPAYRALTVDMDGRIWVNVSQPSEKIPESELPEAAPVVSAGTRGGSPPPRPRRTWREPTAYDVYAPTGVYLGHVEAPPRTTLYRMRGNQVWGVTLDSLDLPTVTRYRVGSGFVVRDRP
jgi:hypothetical protein